MSEQLIKVLQEIGLKEIESKIYLYLLKVGSQPASIIAKRNNINRSTCYLILERLTKKGVTCCMHTTTTKIYYATDPTALLNQIQRKKAIINNQEDSFKKIINDLKNISKEKNVKPKVHFLEGLEGIKQTYEDTLENPGTIFAIESINHMSKEIKEYVFNHYIPKRVKKKIDVKVLMPKTKINTELQKSDEKLLRKTKLIKNKNFDFSIETNIYGNKVALIVYQEGQYTSVIIENKEIQESMLYLFNLLWEQTP